MRISKIFIRPPKIGFSQTGSAFYENQSSMMRVHGRCIICFGLSVDRDASTPRRRNPPKLRPRMLSLSTKVEREREFAGIYDAPKTSIKVRGASKSNATFHNDQLDTGKLKRRLSFREHTLHHLLRRIRH